MLTVWSKLVHPWGVHFKAISSPRTKDSLVIALHSSDAANDAQMGYGEWTCAFHCLEAGSCRCWLEWIPVRSRERGQRKQCDAEKWGQRKWQTEVWGTRPDTKFVRIKIPYLKKHSSLGGLLQTYWKGGAKKWLEEDPKKTHNSCPREKRLAPQPWAGTTSLTCPNSGCNHH